MDGSPSQIERHRLSDDYQSKSTVYFGEDRPDVRKLIPAGVKRLLDVGCGAGEFGYRLKQERGPSLLHVTGLELTDWAEAAQGRLDAVSRLDVERDDLGDLGSFDCISFNDVLEHLVDPWKAVQRICTHLLPGGYLVASSPNLRYFQVVKSLVLSKRFDYVKSGVMDRTHLRFFTCETFPELFESAGLRVERSGGLNGEPFPLKFAVLNWLFLNALDDMRHPQVFCVARKPEP